jgi:tetratricopeptide (TPR) repeat protein
MKRRVGYSLLLVAAVLAVYGRAGTFQFVHYDDQPYLLAPSFVRAGLTASGIATAFTRPHLGNWHPLTTLSYLLDATLWNLNPGPMHLENVALHAANAVLLFLLLLRMTRHELASLVVAALFALHPLHVESVAWVAERKDVLSAFFFLLTLWAYVTWTERPSAVRYTLVVAAYALGLMSKSMLVTVPFVLLLLDYWPLGRRRVTWRRRVSEKLPLLAMAIAVGIVTFIVQHQIGAVMQFEYVDLPDRLGNAAESYLRYLIMMIWPQKLAVFYPLPPVNLGVAAAVGAVMVAISVAAVLLARRKPWIGVGWFWYLGMLLPVIGIVQVGSQSHADRYTYLPLIGVYVAIVWSIAEWTLRRGPRSSAAVGIATVVILVALSVRTFLQVGYWRDSETLYRRALVVEPRNAQIHYNLATMLFENGRYPEAEPHFRAALRLMPEMTQAWCNLALNLAAQSDWPEAEKVIAEAQRRMPESVEVHNAAANVALLHGDLDAAQRSAAEALRLDERSPRAHFVMGRVHATQKRFDDAAEQFRAVVQLTDAWDAHAYLGLVLANQGKSDQAVLECAKALRASPNDPVTHEALAQAHFTAGRLAEANAEFGSLLRLSAVPSTRKYAMLQMGVIALRQKRIEDAVRQFQAVRAIDPADPAANFQLGLIAQSAGHAAEAVKYYRAALASNPGSSARNNLAWILATSPDDSLRHGAEAVRLLEPIRDKGQATTEVLDTLAAAYAESGDFAQAERTAQASVDLAKSRGQRDLAAVLETRLALYRRGKPYRDTPSK